MPRELISSIKKPEFENLVYNIDAFTTKEKNIFDIKVWAYQQDSDEAPEIYIKEKDKVISSEVEPRPDVFKTFKITGKDDNIGFRCKYKAGFGEKATLVIKDSKGKTHEIELNPYSFNLNNLRRIKHLISDYGLLGSIKFVLRDKQRDWIYYDDYYLNKEKIDEKRVKQEIASLEYQPKISVVMPVYNIKPSFLRKAIRSVINQTYPNWELCIADDCSTDPHIRQILSSFAASDPRIKVRFRERNGHISEATNTALSMATGEYIGFMDDDDVLSKRAFHEYVKILNENPDIDVIYCDEDHVNTRDFHFNPFLKPDYNPRMLLSMNYITHFVIIRRTILDKLGGLRSETDGAQDFDLMLRLKEQTDKFYHLPDLLYNWRQTKSSTSYNPEVKNYAFPAGQIALQDYLDRNGLEAEVFQRISPGTYSIRRKEYPPVSMIIPFHDKNEQASVEVLKTFLENTDYDDLEVIAVNYNQAALKNYAPDYDFSKVKFIETEPGNSFELIKFGAKEAKNDFISVVKPGIEPTNPEWLKRMMDETLFDDIGLITPQYIYDTQILSAGYYYDYPSRAVVYPDQFKSIYDLGYFFRAGLSQNIEANFARCFLIRKEDLDQIDELEFLVDPLSGVELSYKVSELGKRVMFTPDAKMEWVGDFSEAPLDNEDYVCFNWTIHPADNYDFLDKYPKAPYEYQSEKMKRYLRSQNQNYKGKKEDQIV